jgi:hypothetical protein
VLSVIVITSIVALTLDDVIKKQFAKCASNSDIQLEASV